LSYDPYWTYANYDAFGRRIAKITGDGYTTVFFYDPSGKMLASYAISTNSPSSSRGLGPTSTTVFFAGQRLAARG